MADELGAELFLQLFVEGLQLCRTCLQDLRADPAGHFGGGGVFAGAEAENMDFRKADFFGESHCLMEIIVCFSGKSNNNVGCNGRAVEGLFDLVDYLQIVVEGVLAAHFS